MKTAWNIVAAKYDGMHWRTGEVWMAREDIESGGVAIGEGERVMLEQVQGNLGMLLAGCGGRVPEAREHALARRWKLCQVLRPRYMP